MNTSSALTLLIEMTFDCLIHYKRRFRINQITHVGLKIHLLLSTEEFLQNSELKLTREIYLT